MGYNFTYDESKDFRDATLRENSVYVPQHDMSTNFTRLLCTLRRLYAKADA